jgi:hypothetical protein
LLFESPEDFVLEARVVAISDVRIDGLADSPSATNLDRQAAEAIARFDDVFHCLFD